MSEENQRKFDKETELAKISFLADEFRAGYQGRFGLISTAMIGVLAVELTASIALTLTGRVVLGLVSLIAAGLITIVVFSPLIYRARQKYTSQLCQIFSLFKKVENCQPLGVLDKLMEDKVVEDKETREPTPPAATSTSEAQKSEGKSIDAEREKLGYFWDYERSHFTQSIVLLFSALIAVATILNAQVASPIIKLNVFYEDAALLIVFAFLVPRLIRVIYRFDKAVVRTNDYLIELNSGKFDIPSLRVLCDVKSDPSKDWEKARSFWTGWGRVLIAIGVIAFVIAANWSQIAPLLGL